MKKTNLGEHEVVVLVSDANNTKIDKQKIKLDSYLGPIGLLTKAKLSVALQSNVTQNEML